jgi:uncharacterized protein YndB with AHSA1/START domain
MREIIRTYDLPYSKEDLWDTVTVYEILIHWLADEVRGRPKLGAEFSWTWKLGEEGDFTTKGVYESIDPGNSIVLRWINHPAGDIFLKLELSAMDSNTTRLTVTNGGFPESSHFDGFLEGAGAGWDDQVDRMKKFLQKYPNPRDAIVKK